MHLMIPELGTRLDLTEDFTFTLYSERRNDTLFSWLGLEKVHPYMSGIRATLPRGTTLVLDRIYVRSGGAEYSSLSFRILADKTRPAKHQHQRKAARFWVKLEEINGVLQYELSAGQIWWYGVAAHLAKDTPVTFKHPRLGTFEARSVWEPRPDTDDLWVFKLGSQIELVQPTDAEWQTNRYRGKCLEGRVVRSDGSTDLWDTAFEESRLLGAARRVL